MSEQQHGGMADINVVPMPRAQAQIYNMVPVEWADIPRIGVADMLLGALRDRGLVETRWRNATVRQWRRGSVLFGVKDGDGGSSI